MTSTAKLSPADVRRNNLRKYQEFLGKLDFDGLVEQIIFQTNAMNDIDAVDTPSLSQQNKYTDASTKRTFAWSELRSRFRDLEIDAGKFRTIRDLLGGDA